ncbi:hypothetical protein TNCV_3403101 [Trichonephila clavipes]|nr:hypothetical protein TNCV_3403101 [Trichonephila clavipes]
MRNILRRSRLKSWTTPSNPDADLSWQDAEGNDEPTENTGACVGNTVMNGRHGPRNVTTLRLLTNPDPTFSITMAEFDFGDTLVRGCWTVALCIAALVLRPVSWFEVLDFTAVPL